VIIHNQIESFNIKNPVVTIGVFDGVHQGHQKVLKRLNQIAEQSDGESVVFTFWPHPRIVLSKDMHSMRLLSTIDEKKYLLSNAGIGHLIINPFTKEFSELTACQFIEEYLVKKIGVKHLLIGYNHRFGKDRKYGFDFLNDCARKYGFSIEKLEAQLVENEKVSSTIIRDFLNQGKIGRANKYLGYTYFISGNVVEGNQIGRKIGFPTANVQVPELYKQIPMDGVYAVRVKLNGDNYLGMLNIGTRPTIQDDIKSKNIEVHIFDFDQKIYHQTITVFFEKRIRDEFKFNSLDELMLQLERDKSEVKGFFGI